MRLRVRPDGTPESVEWRVPLGGQLDFLVNWLDPILDRPFLARVPADALHIALKAADEAKLADAAGRCEVLDPIDALVGPVAVAEEGVVAPVEPVALLQELHDVLPGASSAPFHPYVLFASVRADAEMEEIEVVASDAVLISSVQLVRLRRGEQDVLAELPLGGAA